MSNNQIKIVFGGASIISSTDNEVTEWLDLLKTTEVQTIDTALLYAPSEELLGNAGAANHFIIDTKSPGGFSGEPCTKETIIEHCKASLAKLNTAIVSRVDHTYSPSLVRV